MFSFEKNVYFFLIGLYLVKSSRIFGNLLWGHYLNENPATWNENKLYFSKIGFSLETHLIYILKNIKILHSRRGSWFIPMLMFIAIKLEFLTNKVTNKKKSHDCFNWKWLSSSFDNTSIKSILTKFQFQKMLLFKYHWKKIFLSRSFIEEFLKKDHVAWYSFSRLSEIKLLNIFFIQISLIFLFLGLISKCMLVNF